MTRKLYTGKLKTEGGVVWFGGDSIESGDSLADLQPGVPTLLPPTVYSSLQSQEENNTEEEEPEESN
jgi:hypothetical protein